MSTKIKWVWCKLCDCAAVICPNCGNNCCNGGSGKNCPDNCDEAYKCQSEAEEKGTAPKREECEGEIGG